MSVFCVTDLNEMTLSNCRTPEIGIERNAITPKLRLIIFKGFHLESVY